MRARSLREYIKRHGEVKAALQLGITLRALRSYRYGARTPRPAQALKMAARSRGQLSVASIYADLGEYHRG